MLILPRERSKISQKSEQNPVSLTIICNLRSLTFRKHPVLQVRKDCVAVSKNGLFSRRIGTQSFHRHATIRAAGREKSTSKFIVSIKHITASSFSIVAHCYTLNHVSQGRGWSASSQTQHKPILFPPGYSTTHCRFIDAQHEQIAPQGAVVLFPAGMIGRVPNPFTKSIAAALRSRSISMFVRRWDALEALVIRVYRAGAAASADAAEYASLNGQLRPLHKDLTAKLEPLWRNALMSGAPANEDPFALLLAPSDASGFVDNWRAMQALAAARESLNRLILEAQA
jgi:hypothetical protein